MWDYFIVFILIGLVTGLLAGLLGIGGGVITVPCLYYLFSFTELPESRWMQIAASTSLAATCITSLASTLAHHQKKSILLPPLKLLVPGLVLGSITGSYLSHQFSSHTVRIIFGGLSLLLGVYFFFPHLPHLRLGSHINRGLSVFGVLIGTLSSLLGIGGGLFTIPILMGYQVPLKNALGTSSVSTLFSAFLGTFSYLLIGWGKNPIPYTVGFIYLPALIFIASASLCTSPIGAHLSHFFSVTLIKRILGAVIIFTGLTMFLF